MKTIILLCTLLFSLNAQTFKGYILDSDTKEIIPYASVGIFSRQIGTLSNDSGYFELKLTTEILNDSIEILAIGYEPIKLLLKKMNDADTIWLTQSENALSEVTVSGQKLYSKKIGEKSFSNDNCSGFVSSNENWIGSETAVKFENSKQKLYYLKNLEFYIIKNLYVDSIRFRINIYSSSTYYPASNMLTKPIYLKTNIKSGIVNVPLTEYNIKAYDSFYISIECLEKNMDIKKFCFAGNYNTPAYIREHRFKKWRKVKGGGAMMILTVYHL
ncbi:MAG: carboxypeptidase-like regulatory domain-containing protein [Bacteroidia bacterium]